MVRMWLLFFGFAEIWRLAGTEKPVFSLGGNREAFWLVRKGDGALPSLWHVAAGKSGLIDLPENSIFLAVHPDSNDLIVVTPKHIAAYRVTKTGLAETRRFWSPLQPYAPHGPPLFGQIVLLNDVPYLVFFHDGLCNAIALAGASSGFQIPSSKAFGFTDEVALMNPLVQSWGQVLMWMGDEGLHTWSPLQKSPLASLPFPELGSMEKAVALPSSDGSPAWLVYGGKRGELGSFGWKVGEGSTTVSGKGILARFGTDTTGDLTRLFVLTVSNRVGSHLWSAVSGKTEFQCTMLVRRGEKWQVVNRLTFKMKKSKSKPRKAFGVTWTTDYNSDGWGDLVISDEKRGVQAYLSDTTGGLGKTPIKLNGAIEAIINLPNALLVCRSQGEHWIAEVLQQ